MKNKIRRRKIISGIIAAVGSVAIILIICTIVQNASYNSSSKHHHVYYREVVREATCAENGTALYTCLGCRDTYEEEIPRTGHSIADWGDGDGSIRVGRCKDCGVDVNYMYNRNTGVKFIAPVNTRGKSAAATVINSDGYAYKYIIYRQGAGYNSYSNYLKEHGCSTCALTSFLNAACSELDGYTPDRIIEEIEPDALGEEAFYKNYSYDHDTGKMPLTLSAMTTIFDKYGIDYKRPAEDRAEQEREIEEHLQSGNPVIVTFGNGSAGGLTGGVHTILLIGIDTEGHVIIADSVLKKSSVWDANGLIKPGRLTAGDIVSYINSKRTWRIAKDTPAGDSSFYRNSSDRGYLMLYGRTQ